MSGGEIEEARILDILLKLEAHIERVVEHEDRIRLTSLLHIVDGVEERKSLRHLALSVGIILYLETKAMALGIPVAYVGTYPYLALKLLCNGGNLSLIEHRIGPCLSGHLVVVELTHAEACEESHKLQWHIILVGRDEGMIVGVATVE